VKFLTESNNYLVDLLNGLGLDVSDIVSNGSIVTADILIACQDRADGPQTKMVFGEVLKLVVIEIAGRSQHCQDEDLPVIKAWPSGVTPDWPSDVTEVTLIDVGGDEFGQPLPQRLIQ